MWHSRIQIVPYTYIEFCCTYNVYRTYFSLSNAVDLEQGIVFAFDQHKLVYYQKNRYKYTALSL
jgi:hypothetical protein